MCHQSVGLLQGAIEAASISTIGITVRPEVTVNMCVPRAVYVRFPTGNPVGEPHKPNQQRRILRGVLAALEAIQEPGTVLELPFRWRRMGDEDDPAPRDLPSPLEGEPGCPPAGGGVRGNSGDPYATAQSHVATIQDNYTALMASLDAYRTWLQTEVAAEQGRSQPDATKLQALNPQLKYLDELAAALEGPAHDGLVRVSDRVVRIRHWQDGTFI